MALEFSKAVAGPGGPAQSFHRYEPEDDVFRHRRLEAFDVMTSSLNSRLIFDGMVAIEGCLGGIGALVCFAGSRAVEFQRGLGQLFLDVRPAGSGLVACGRAWEPELTVTVFGVWDADAPEGKGVACIRAAAWSYVNHGTGLFGKRKMEGHLPAFPVE